MQRKLNDSKQAEKKQQQKKQQMPTTSKIEVKIDMQETQPSRIYQHVVIVF